MGHPTGRPPSGFDAAQPAGRAPVTDCGRRGPDDDRPRMGRCGVERVELSRGTIDQWHRLDAGREPAGGYYGYRDASVVERTTYQYRVTAINSAGPSAWSNTASGADARVATERPSRLVGDAGLPHDDRPHVDGYLDHRDRLRPRAVSNGSATWTAIGGSLAANTTRTATPVWRMASTGTGSRRPGSGRAPRIPHRHAARASRT